MVVYPIIATVTSCSPTGTFKIKKLPSKSDTEPIPISPIKTWTPGNGWPSVPEVTLPLIVPSVPAIIKLNNTNNV